MAPLERAFDVLEYVADRGEVRVGEICQDLKLPRPTVHRLLTVLIDRGYLDHDPVRHVYRTGPTTTRIAAHTKASRVVQFGEPALVAMREASGETANLGIVRGGRIVYAATLDGFRFPRMSVTIGEDVPPHAAAIGKALLADLGEQERTRLLGPSRTRATPSALLPRGPPSTPNSPGFWKEASLSIVKKSTLTRYVSPLQFTVRTASL